MPKPKKTGKPCPEITPRKRKPGGGRKPKRAGRVRVHFSASLDTLAIGEIQRRATLAGQSANDYLSALFEPEPVNAPQGPS